MYQISSSMEKESNWIHPIVDHMNLGKKHSGTDHFIWPRRVRRNLSVFYIYFFLTRQVKALLNCKRVKQSNTKCHIKPGLPQHNFLWPLHFQPHQGLHDEFHLQPPSQLLSNPPVTITGSRNMLMALNQNTCVFKEKQK